MLTSEIKLLPCWLHTRCSHPLKCKRCSSQLRTRYTPERRGSCWRSNTRKRWSLGTPLSPHRTTCSQGHQGRRFHLESMIFGTLPLGSNLGRRLWPQLPTWPRVELWFSRPESYWLFHYTMLHPWCFYTSCSFVCWGFSARWNWGQRYVNMNDGRWCLIYFV